MPPRRRSRTDVIKTAVERAESGMRPGGFGMLIVRQIVDELVYNERGNEVLLIKHLEVAFSFQLASFSYGATGRADSASWS